MIAKITSALIGIPLLALLAVLAWGGLRSPTSQTAPGNQSQPAATLSEQLSEGLIEAQVYVLGDLSYRIDIQFSPEATSTIPASMPPDVIMAMVSMHMDGFDPPLELLGAGMWRTQGKLPMAGDWILNVGYGDDFAEATFNVE
ncbi:hypothetical protein [Cypionkella psychrotolerans]|uniref:hypothetical protein n=1 Tax=Cypionkella psychrotolerans TaxID=1678131 RepID=UPI0006B55D71|nr:hypothetical protein [Cypionkella psychrotolerans]